MASPPPPPFFSPQTQASSPNSSNQHTSAILIIFVSFGFLLFLGSLCLAFWYVIKKNKKHHKKETKRVQETEDVDMDEHLKVQEVVVPGRHGPKIEMLSVEDEMNIHEHMRKNETDKVDKGVRGGAVAAQNDIEAGRGDGFSSSHGQKYV